MDISYLQKEYERASHISVCSLRNANVVRALKTKVITKFGYISYKKKAVFVQLQAAQQPENVPIQQFLRPVVAAQLNFVGVCY